MKYIKTYEESSIEYKDGDIVVLDIEKIKNFYENPNIRFFDNLKPIQLLYVDDNQDNDNDNQDKYIKNDIWKSSINNYTDKFYIYNEFIKRLATPEEVDEYWIRQKADKYNL